MAVQTFTIEETATRLGLHYMTVYRYVRIGRLPAEYRDGRWHIAPADLPRVTGRPARRHNRHSKATAQTVAGPSPHAGPSPSAGRMYDRLLAGDGPGAWLIVENALLAGGPSDVYLRILGPALKEVGTAWETGRISVADEHRATIQALGIVGRMGPLFGRRGRRRPAAVLLAGAEGDPHAIPLIMVGDLLRAAGFQVIQLGADVPLDTLLVAAEAAGPALIGLSASTQAATGRVAQAVAALHGQDADRPVLVGGPAVDSEAAAVALGADGWGADAATAVARAVELTGAPA